MNVACKMNDQNGILYGIMSLKKYSSGDCNEEKI